MKRRQVNIGLGVMALVAGLLLVWPARPRPSEATFGQIREGMTYEEVCATVGAPPGDYRSDPGVTYWGPMSYSWFGSTTWRADDASLSVFFGESGRVARVAVSPAIELSRRLSLMDRLRARIGP